MPALAAASPLCLPFDALQAPWWQPYRAWLAVPGAQAPLPTAQRLNALAGEAAAESGAAAPVRFVAEQALPPGQAYEAFIHATGQVPTRDNWHDGLNGLVWLRFPQAKRRLNQLQAAEIARHGVRARRGAVRDAITLFDESGALLQAPPPLWEALLARDWPRLFVTLRPLWREAHLLVFGHAALEKLVSPRKDVTVHVWRSNAAMESIANLDAWLAGELHEAALAAKPFTPLPVLGVPGWWAGNENFSFYDDSLVFRPRRPAPTT